MNDIRIKISADTKGIDEAKKKTEELGDADKKNAEQFKKNNIDYKEAAKIRAQLLDSEIKNLKKLKSELRRTYDPGEIQSYNAAISLSKERVKLLSAEYGHVKGSMQEVIVTGQKMAAVIAESSKGASSLGSNVKTAYSWLRQAALIIPGIGISGLILAGYEVLVALIQEMVSGYEDSADAIKENYTELQRQIDKQIELDILVDKGAREYLKLAGLVSDADIKRFEAQDDFEKRDEDITKKKLEHFTSLAKAYSMNADDFKLYSERIARAGSLTEKQIIAINDALKIDGGKGLEGNLEKRLNTVDTFLNQIGEDEQKYIKERKTNEIIFEQDVSNIQKEAYLKKQKELGKHHTKIAKLDDSAWRNYLKIWEQNFRELLRMQKEEENELLKAEKDYWDKSNKMIEDNRKLQLENDGLEAKIKKDKVAEEDARYQTELENFKIQYEEKKRISGQNADGTLRYEAVVTEESERHLELMREQHQQNLTEIDEKASNEREKKRKEDTEKVINDLKLVTDAVIKEYETRVENNIKYYDHQQELTKANIETQAKLAAAGKENTLAQEQKNLADEERKRQQETQKLKKAKELEVFLNALASFSKDDPKQAFAKALALYAETKAFEATFAEEGALLGKSGNQTTSIIGLNFSKRHKSGNDILVHAEKGEGILTTKEVANLGGEKGFFNFKKLLENPLNETPIPMTGVMFQQNSNKALEAKVDYLTEVIRNKKEVEVHWESLKERDFMVVTTVEKGIREIVKHELKRPKINR